MSNESKVKKDRLCRICGDIRLRTAEELIKHASICQEAEDIIDRLHKAGLYAAHENRMISTWS